MSDRIERMRAKQAEKSDARIPPTGGSSTAPPRKIAEAPEPPKEKPKKPPEPKATIKHACGHEVGLKDVQNRPCPACVHKSKLARAARRKAAREEKYRQQAIEHEAFRLPDGSVYHKVYDAAKKQWTVTLTFPHAGGQQIFEAKGSGSFRTEVAVDRLYRQWLEQEGKES